MKGMRRFTFVLPVKHSGPKATITSSQIEEQTKEYLAKGGTITVVDGGYDEASKKCLSIEQHVVLHTKLIVK